MKNDKFSVRFENINCISILFKYTFLMVWFLTKSYEGWLSIGRAGIVKNEILFGRRFYFWTGDVEKVLNNGADWVLSMCREITKQG